MFILYLFSGLSISCTINVLNLFMSFTYKISSNICCSLYPNFLSFSYKQTQKAPLPQQGSMIAGKSFNFFYRQLQYLLQFSIISWQMLIGVSISALCLRSYMVDVQICYINFSYTVILFSVAMYSCNLL